MVEVALGLPGFLAPAQQRMTITPLLGQRYSLAVSRRLEDAVDVLYHVATDFAAADVGSPR